MRTARANRGTVVFTEYILSDVFVCWVEGCGDVWSRGRRLVMCFTSRMAARFLHPVRSPWTHDIAVGIPNSVTIRFFGIAVDHETGTTRSLVVLGCVFVSVAFRIALRLLFSETLGDWP